MSNKCCAVVCLSASRYISTHQDTVCRAGQRSGACIEASAQRAVNKDGVLSDSGNKTFSETTLAVRYRGTGPPNTKSGRRTGSYEICYSASGECPWNLNTLPKGNSN